MIRSYRDLRVWQDAMNLAERCYKVSRRLPEEEKYGLTQQLRRASVSIPSNIAEGHARRTTQIYVHHLSISLGSQAELETLLELIRRLGYLSGSDLDQVDAMAASVGRQLNGLIRSLVASRSAPRGRRNGHVG